MMRVRRFLVIGMVFLLVFSACKDGRTTKLLYQGHASFRLTAKNGTVIYIDPAYGDGYDIPADIILVTHGHFDHNKVNLVTQKQDCTIITNDEAQKDKKYNSFKIKGIKIESVEAYDRGNHHRSIGVGYIVTVDGIKLYHTGDSTKTDQMETLPEKKLDYALVYIGGVPEAAAEWTKIIGAKNSIPMHTSPPGILFDRRVAERFDVPGRIIIEPKEEIELSR
jgi:L-ascorbate metabolism protein UlaG (beta-lactamase superfamily)